MREHIANRSSHTPIPFVLLVLAVQVLGCGVTPAAPAQGLPASTERTSHEPVGATATVSAQDLPVGQYVRLRKLALSSASARPSRRIRNPRVAGHGLDRTVLAVLDQQREYLHKHAARLPEASLQIAGHMGVTPNSARDMQLRKAAPGSPSCLNPIIAAVNGRSKGVLFTPRTPDNHYRIEGCGFGQEAGEVWLEFERHDSSSGARVQPIPLPLDHSGSWSDKEVDVHLDPHLSGISDSAITLAVHLLNGKRAELPACRFIAVRGQPTPLKTVVASWVKLDATTARSRPIQQLEYVSPLVGGEEVPHDAAGMSALVVRSDPEAFMSGTDSYDLSALAPGWVVESVELENYLVTCPGDVTSTQQTGSWNTTFDVYSFTVNWANNSCLSFIPPRFRFGMTSSQYAVKVWVVGPAGTEPMRMDFSDNRNRGN